MEIIKNIKTYDDFETALNGKIIDFSEKENGVITTYYPDNRELEITLDIRDELKNNFFTSEEVFIKIKKAEEKLEEEFSEKLIKYCCLTAGVTAVCIVVFANLLFGVIN